MKTRASNGVKDSSSEEKQFDTAGDIHRVDSDCLRGKQDESRLTYLTRENPALTRRAILIWWIKVCHPYSLLSIRKNRGGLQCHTRVGLFSPHVNGGI